MGLLDFFRRRGGVDPSSGASPEAEGPTDVEERDEASVGPPGFAAEGPPVGISDPGSLTGEDADELAGPEAEDAAEEQRPPGA